MRIVSLEEVQSHLPDLLSHAAEGDQFTVVQDGLQLAELVKKTGIPRDSATTQPLASTPKRRLGALKGMFVVPDDIKEPFREEIEEMFYGKE